MRSYQIIYIHMQCARQATLEDEWTNNCYEWQSFWMWHPIETCLFIKLYLIHHPYKLFQANSSLWNTCTISLLMMTENIQRWSKSWTLMLCSKSWALRLLLIIHSCTFTHTHDGRCQSSHLILVHNPKYIIQCLHLMNCQLILCWGSGISHIKYSFPDIRF